MPIHNLFVALSLSELGLVYTHCAALVPDPRTPVMPFLVSRVLTETQASILGGSDLATCFTLFLQGVLCSQFSRYMDSVKRDSVQIKLFVAGLALLTTIKTSECLAMMWTQNVTLFENVKVASTLWQTAWYSKLAVLLKVAVPFYVQLFFCYRLWAISRNVYVVMICIMVFSFALVCGVLATFYLFTAGTTAAGLNLMNRWVERHMGVVVFGDLILTGSIIFWLLRHNKAVLSRGPTATILSSLVRLAVQSAVPLTLCSLINFGVSTYRPNVHGTQAFLKLNFITTGILPQLYAWSAMWTLNSRDEIAAGGNTPYTIDLGIASCESDVNNGQLPHASNGAVTNESAATHQASSQTFGEP
ncbi:hypothetical protein C8R45DRAFT_428197 [Mycena sanguinolenta]|nr:hypothetical protein C8R45DRAFT_428197 [Mycena sanguinolenta]